MNTAHHHHGEFTATTTLPSNPDHRQRRRWLGAMVPVAALTALATACGGGVGQSGGSGGGGGYGGGGGSSASSPPSSSAAGGEAEAVKTAKTSKLGMFLVDEKGRTVYLFEKDKGSESTCYGACAKVWPPVTTSATPKAEGQAKGGKLGTTKRKNGTKQVTYAGHPLYYYAPDDHKAHSTKGQALKQFGAEWYVLSPKGEKVEQGGS